MTDIKPWFLLNQILISTIRNQVFMENSFFLKKCVALARLVLH